MLIPNLSRAIQSFAAVPGEDPEIRSEKNAILLVASSCTVAGSIWAVMYVAIYGPSVTSLLPALFSVIVGTAIVLTHLTKNHKIAIYAQILAIMLITTAIQWSIGGIADSGFVIVWALLGPLGAIIFLSPKEATAAFLIYLLVLLVTVGFDGYLSERALASSAQLRAFYFTLNLGVSATVIFFFVGYVARSMISHRAVANLLLLNVLPAQIAKRLKANEGIIADQYPSVSILFADAVDSRRRA
jgi:hypothetical protein